MYQRSVFREMERNLITKNKIKKTADESSKAGTAKNDKWLKSLYKIIRSDDMIAAQFLSNSSVMMNGHQILALGQLENMKCGCLQKML